MNGQKGKASEWEQVKDLFSQAAYRVAKLLQIVSAVSIIIFLVRMTSTISIIILLIQILSCVQRQ